MDAKEIKACLKTAREAIRQKDFQEAAKQCKAILEFHKDNYNALVFLGVAAEGMEKPEQAVKAYKRAIDEQPDQPLAWQGLGTVIDKNPGIVDIKEAIQILEKLVSLSASDVTKQISYLHKLISKYDEAKMFEKAYQICLQLLGQDSDPAGQLASHRVVVSLLSQSKLVMDSYMEEQYQTSLQELLKSSDLSVDDITAYVRMFLLLIAKRDLRLLEQHCKDLRARFPEAIVPHEFLLQLLLDESIQNVSITEEVIQEVKSATQSLQDLNPHHEMVSVGQAFSELSGNNLTKARSLLSAVSKASVCGQFYLAKTCARLHDWDSSLQACKSALSAISKGPAMLCCNVLDATNHIKRLLAEAYAQNKSPSSQDSCMTILEEIQHVFSTEAAVLRSEILLDQGKIEEAEMCLKDLPQDEKTLSAQANVCLFKKEYQDAMKILEPLVQEYPHDAKARHLLSQALWGMRTLNSSENLHQLCVTSLLKAAKLDPYFFGNFLYLGHFYKEIQQDLMKAKRCYQRAFELNSDSVEAGCGYCDALAATGEEEQGMAILQAVTSNAVAGSAKWAWLRLGLHQLLKEEPTSAIVSLQSALRANPNDHHVWECLSEAYWQRGSFTAALKAYGKAFELDSSCLYCLNQMANIKQSLGSLSEAVEEYKAVLAKDNHYVPALKGLGESLLLKARSNLSKCLDGLAQDCMEEAIGYLARAAIQRPGLSCLWKLLGDAAVCTVPLASNSFKVPSKMVEKAESCDTSIISKAELLQVGARCYARALKVMPESSPLWHDLGVCLFHQSQCQGAAVDLTLLERSSSALKKAITLEPKGWNHWNALGVVACHKAKYAPAFAQHCFIMSLEVEHNNVLAWSNLGVLYIQEGNIQLAHDAFKAAQSVDPTYVASWVGQALIAEAVGHEEAMDLFRHTTELGLHLESAIGYGHWVLHTLAEHATAAENGKQSESELFHYCIKQMAAIPAASDALIKYTVRVPTDPIAYNMLGLLQEHSNHLQSAEEAFQKALQLLEADGTNDVHMNLARVLCKQGKYQQCLSELGKVNSELDQKHACLMGLAEARNRNLVQAANAYQLALEMGHQDDPVHSDLHTALGMLAYMENDYDGSKGHFFNAFQTEKPSIQGLHALCGLGLLQGDHTLTSAVMSELAKREDGLPKELGLLQLYTAQVQGTNTDGEAELQELIGSNPNWASSLYSLWASYLIAVCQNKSEAAIALALLGQDGETRDEKSFMLEALGQLQAGQHNRHKPSKNAVKAAQRSFHRNPGDVSAACTLASAIHGEAIFRRGFEGQTCLFEAERGLLKRLLGDEKCNGEIRDWCHRQLIICFLELGDDASAKEMCKQLKSSKKSPLFVETVEMALAPDSDALNPDKVKDSLALLTLIFRLQQSGKFVKSMDLLQQQQMGKKKKKQQFLPSQSLIERTIHAAFLDLQRTKETDNSTNLQEAFDARLKEAKDKDVLSPLMLVMQGIQSLTSNARLAKHCLGTTLSEDQAQSRSDYLTSLARQGLVLLLHTSTKESDSELIQVLMGEAKADGDQASLDLFQELCGNRG